MLWIHLLYKLTRKYFGFSPILSLSFSVKKKRVRLQAVWGLQRPGCPCPLPHPVGGRGGLAQGRGGALGPAAGWGPVLKALARLCPRGLCGTGRREGGLGAPGSPGRHWGPKRPWLCSISVPPFLRPILKGLGCVI